MQMRAESAGFFGVLTTGSVGGRGPNGAMAVDERSAAGQARRSSIERLLEQLLAEAKTSSDPSVLVRRYAALIEAVAGQEPSSEKR